MKQNLYVLYLETLNFSPLEKYTQQYSTVHFLLLMLPKPYIEVVSQETLLR